jgi:LemA protein
MMHLKKLSLQVLALFIPMAFSGCGYNTMQAQEEAVFAA